MLSGGGAILTRRLRAPRAPSEAREKQLLFAPCRLCFCGSAGSGGESTCGEGPPTPWRRYLARRTPGRPHLGQRGFPAPPCRRAAPGRRLSSPGGSVLAAPGDLQAPAGQELALPFPSREGADHPLPREGRGEASAQRT